MPLLLGDKIVDNYFNNDIYDIPEGVSDDEKSSWVHHTIRWC